VNQLGIEATTWIIYHSAKIRVFLLNENSSPFVGLGLAKSWGGFDGGKGNDWFTIHAGWEQGYEKTFLQFFLQAPLTKSLPDRPFPFYIGLGIGLRTEFFSRAY
jgi:hypothetical protein